MKRMLTVILGLILASGIAFAAPTNTAPSQGVTFAEGINSKKTMIVLLYAPWSKSTKQVKIKLKFLKLFQKIVQLTMLVYLSGFHSLYINLL